MSEPRAYTPLECRQMIVVQFRALASYWADAAKRGHDHPFLGLVHSILAAIDGEGGLPALKLVADPHPDDEAYHRGEGENWWPRGADITENAHLHDLLYAAAAPPESVPRGEGG